MPLSYKTKAQRGKGLTSPPDPTLVAHRCLAESPSAKRCQTLQDASPSPNTMKSTCKVLPISTEAPNDMGDRGMVGTQPGAWHTPIT